MVRIPMKRAEKLKSIPIITFFVKGLLKMKKALSFHAPHALKNFRLTRLLRIFSSIVLSACIMISMVVSPFAICSSTRIPRANAYITEYNGSTSRFIAPTSFSPENNWRQNNFQTTVTGSVTSPFLVSVTACDIYGEALEKWVSIYDDNNVLAYDSGWTFAINDEVSRNPLSVNGTMHVIIRLRYKGGDVPLTPQVMTTTNFTLRFTRREEVTRPPGWNETTTATYTTATQILPDLTTGTEVTIAATPERLLTHERFFLRVLDNLWGLPDVMWLTIACIILVFCAWLLL